MSTATVMKFDPADWMLLKMLKECKEHYKTLPYKERERFLVTERKERQMFMNIVSSSVVEVAA